MIRPQYPTAGRGRLAENIVHFARALRGAGLSVGPGAVVDAVSAVDRVGFGVREDFYWVLHALFVKRREDHIVFDQAFRLFWRDRPAILVADSRNGDQKLNKPKPGSTRAQAAIEPEMSRLPRQVESELVPGYMAASDIEQLKTRDFAGMTVEELAIIKRAMRNLQMPADRVHSRRKTRSRRGRFDPRRTLRESLKTGGEVIVPRYRSPTIETPPLVVLCDISGSMDDYSRIFLHFLHALALRRRKFHCFVFGTRLTNITRQLRAKDVDEALDACADIVSDWSGGTRIASAIGTFNKTWSRRVLGQRPTVLLMTDGLERDPKHDLGYEMDRLHRSCKRLIWLNPLLRYEGFQPKAQGIRAMLPHVDDFRTIHSLQSVQDLVDSLSQVRSVQPDFEQLRRVA